MARSKDNRTDRPLPSRAFLAVYRASASMYLAFLVIGVSAVVLGWATFVESWYGTEAVAFGVYGASWFRAIMLLLGINVLMAAVVRFPWKRRHTGFLITHTGIIILLLGCVVSARSGFEAFLSIFEGSTGQVAIKKTQHFEIQITSNAKSDEDVASVRTIDVPFRSGPFNSQDLATPELIRWPGNEYDGFFWFPWRLADRDQGVIFDADGIKLEVLDYCSDSRTKTAEPMVVRAKGRPTSDAGEPDWNSYRLGMQSPNSAAPSAMSADAPRRASLPGGELICSWAAGSMAETRAFVDSGPQGDLGRWGQLVFCVGEETIRLSADDLVMEEAAIRPQIDQLEQDGSDPARLDQLRRQLRKPLGASGLTVELDRSLPSNLAVILLVRRGDQSPRQMVLYAYAPEFSTQDVEHGVFASYWVDAEAVNAQGQVVSDDIVQMASQPRFDILRGSDGKLHYRVWRSPKIEETGTLSADGEQVAVLEDTDFPLSVRVDQFTPNDFPGYTIQPVGFDKDRGPNQRQRRVLLRATVDGLADEFWLDGTPDPSMMMQMPFMRHVVHGKNRSVAIRLPWDEVDVGFSLYLRNFQRKLDPGTSMASHYYSIVDRVDPKNPSERIERDIRIDLNQPVVMTDPVTKRVFRLYQTSFNGPHRPGSPVYDQILGGRVIEGEDRPRDELFSSTFTVNYDPGRGLKYLGCLLIVVGSGIMFYMRAYFARKPGGEEPEAESDDSEAKAG